MQDVQDSYGLEQKRPRGNPNYGIAMPYSKVREIIKPYKFKSVREYRQWVEVQKATGKGDGLPLNPYAVYTRKNEWVSTKHFLGLTDDITSDHRKSTVQPQKSEVSFSSIRAIIKQILGIKREKVSV